MAQITEYKCINCGLELVDDGRRFYYDDESKQTIDFLWLMSTAGCDMGSKIKGRASETYCGNCKKPLKIYIIEECAEDISNPCEMVKEGIKNYAAQYPGKISELKEIRKNPNYTFEPNEYGAYTLKVPEFNDFQFTNITNPEWSKKKAMKYVFDEFYKDINELIRYYEETYENYLNSIYLIIDKSNDSEYDYDSLEKVHCPECNKEIYKNFHYGMPCPNCEFPLARGSTADVD